MAVNPNDFEQNICQTVDDSFHALMMAAKNAVSQNWKMARNTDTRYTGTAITTHGIISTRDDVKRKRARIESLIEGPMLYELRGDWRPVSGDVADFQNEARKKHLFTDVCFVIGEGESSKTFSAHKAILACGSPVFEKMFYGEIPEIRSVIKIEDDNPEDFEMLLSSLYGQSLHISSFIRAWKYYAIGDKYLVSSIKAKAKLLFSRIPIDELNFWEIIQEDIFSCPIIAAKTFSYVRVNAWDLMECEKTIDMPETVINTILRMDKLNISEYELLISVTKWAHHYIGSDADSKDLLKYFKHIRFSTLKTHDFKKFIRAFPNAIDSQSSMDILNHLNNHTNKLPLWCSTRKDYRNEEQMVRISPTKPGVFDSFTERYYRLGKISI